MREVNLSIGLIVPDHLTDGEVRAVVQAATAVALVELMACATQPEKAACQYAVEIEGPGTMQ